MKCRNCKHKWGEGEDISQWFCRESIKELNVDGGQKCWSINRCVDVNKDDKCQEAENG